MTHLLAIETSSIYCSIALFIESNIALEKTIPLERGHATILIPMIQNLMTETSIHMMQLTHVAVGRGPGSFTGLRVGMSAAQGLGVALNIPVKAVTTFDSMLEMTSPIHQSNLLTIVDTKRGDFYTCYYHKKSKEISILTLDQIHSFIKKTNCHVVVDHLSTFDPIFQNATEIIPTAVGVGRHALNLLEISTPEELFYMRSPSVT